MHRDRCFVIWLSVLLGVCSGVRAAQGGWEALEEKVKASALVVWGEVTEQSFDWHTDERGTHIYSHVIIVPTGVVLGAVSKMPISLEVIGGTVAGITEWASDAPSFREGEEVIVFLQDDPLRLIPGPKSKMEVYDGQVYWQGLDYQPLVFLEALERLHRGEDLLVFRSMASQPLVLTTKTTPKITDINPSQASAGTGEYVTITGEHFGNSQGSGEVLFEGSTSASIYSWSDTQIVCIVPDSISSGPVTVQTDQGTSNRYVFEVKFGYSQYKWADASIVIDYYINENTFDCKGEGMAVQCAASTWGSTGGPSLSYQGEHTNINDSLNGINEVLWGSAGSLAYARMWFGGAGLIECDIVFNDTYEWSTAATPAGGEIDVETVALHEMGHWMGLSDLYGSLDTDKVMYGYVTAGTTKRSLHSADEEGVEWIYHGSAFEPPPVCDPPSSPTGVTASEGTYCDRVHVTWDLVSAATGYEIWRSDSSLRWTASLLGESGGTTYDDMSAVSGRDYTYWVRAVDRCGGSEFSVGVSGFLKPGRVPPATITASDGEYCDRIDIAWPSVNGAIGYEVWRNTNSGVGTSQRVAEVVGTFYQDNTVQTGIVYTYWVKTQSDCGTSDFSSGDTGYRAEVMSAPTGVSASEGTTCGYILLIWNPVLGATGYEVWRATEDHLSSAVKLTEQVETFYNDDNADIDVTYTYWIKALSGCGSSDFSASRQGVYRGFSTAPVYVSASDGTSTEEIMVTWAVVTNAEYYEVWRGEHADTGAMVKLANRYVNYYDDQEAQPEVTYYYRIKAYASCGVGDFSDYDAGFRLQPVVVPKRDTAQVLYVDGAASAGGNGNQWAQAFRHLQDALALAGKAPKVYKEIRVAAGTYRPDEGQQQILGDVKATFMLVSGVALRGGYAGRLHPEEPDRRDISQYQTILSGLVQQSQDPAELCGSTHVVTARQVDPNTLLEGVVIANGGIKGISLVSQYGGGLHIDRGDLTIRCCIFRQNHTEGFEVEGEHANQYAVGYGGAVYNWLGRPIFEYCVFHDNAADYGGGLYSRSGAPVLIGCLLESNIAKSGGALVTRDQDVLIMTNCIVVGNRARSLNQALALEGQGGALMSFSGSSIDVYHCTFMGNQADQWGHTVSCDDMPLVSGTREGKIQFLNSILWDDSLAVNNSNGSALSIAFCNIQAGQATVRDPQAGLSWGLGNIDQLPSFVAPGAWALPKNITVASEAVWIGGDYRLNTESPCVDTGDVSSVVSDITDLDQDGDVFEPVPFDYARDPRFVGDGPDMGAYELSTTP